MKTFVKPVVKPYYDLRTAVDMPPPGPDFIAAANAMASGDEASAADLVNHYYRSALYIPGYQLNVVYKNSLRSVRMIPGHLMKVVYGADDDERGPVKADVMVIGKLPGKDEADYTINFIGPSGYHFRESLVELAEPGNEDYFLSWYVTNLVKFAHPEPKDGGTLPPAWVKDCLPLLHQELRIVRPKYILCLGSEATTAVLGRGFNLSNTAGRILEYQIPIGDGSTGQYTTAQVITAIHPAAVTRDPDLQPRLLSAIHRFKNLVEGVPTITTDPDLDHRVLKDQAALASVVDEVIASGEEIIAVDCEWHGDYPTEKNAYLRTIQFSHKAKSAFCVVLRNAGGSVGFSPSIDSAIKELKRLFKPKNGRKVRVAGHFFRADLPWLLSVGLDLRPEYDAPDHWDLTKDFGGFDTGAAAHAHTEAGQEYKLEILAANLLGTPRYDIDLINWKKAYCKENKIKADDLEGYGDCPDEILHPYSMLDACVTRRLVDVYNGIGTKPGLLDSDRYGNNCRKAFWLTQRAALAFLEMEMNGVELDRDKVEQLTRTYIDGQRALLDSLRSNVGWPDFNPNSDIHKRELLFGAKYNNRYHPSGQPVRVRPEGAKSLGLRPLLSTGHRKKSWDDIVKKNDEHNHRPSCDKETLSSLAVISPEVAILRDERFLAQTLRSVLRKPNTDDEGNEERDEQGNLVFDKGLASYVHADGRVRTHYYTTLETGRCSSARPNLQNASAKREADYKRILGSRYTYPLRSILRAAPGNILISADYSGAEVLAMAINAEDATLLDHAQRSALPEDHPDYYDIHSNVAVQTFKLSCAPTKKALKEIGKAHLRVAAKAVFFGYAYGQGPDAAARKAR